MNRYAFVCHPLRADTPEGIKANIEVARQYGARLLEAGWCPLVTQMMLEPLGADDHNPLVRQMAMQLSRDLITFFRPTIFMCGNTLSPGMSEELILSQSLGLRICSIHDIHKEIPRPEELYQ